MGPLGGDVGDLRVRELLLGCVGNCSCPCVRYGKRNLDWYWHRIVDPGRRFWVPLKSLVDYPYDLEYTGEIDQYDPPENAGAPLKALKLDSEATAHHFLDENLPELIKLGPVEDTRVYFFFM